MKDLIKNIIEELIQTETSLSSPLFKTKFLATKIENNELLEWVNNELNGYKVEKNELNEKVPEYRKTGATLFGTYYQNMGNGTKQLFENMILPTQDYDEVWRNFFQTITLYESVPSLELTHSQSKSKNIIINIPPEIGSMIQKKISKLNPYIELILVKKEASSAIIIQVITSVRYKLLDFMLAIDNQFGDIIDFSFLIQNKEQITTIVNQSIINNSGDSVLINTGDSNKIKISNNYAERKKLIDKTSEIIELLKKELDVSEKNSLEILAGFEVIFNELQKNEPNKLSISETLSNVKKYGEALIFSHELTQAMDFFSKLLI